MRFSTRALAILVCLLTAACSANRVELRSDAKDVAFRAVGGESLGGSPLVLEGDGLAKARQQDGRLAVQVSAPGYLTREVILDVHGLSILDPVALEASINNIPGVVTVGLFALRGADVLLLGTSRGVQTLRRK